MPLGALSLLRFYLVQRLARPRGLLLDIARDRITLASPMSNHLASQRQ
jgi:hypothetical protein